MKGIGLLWEDIKKSYAGILAGAACILIFNLIFGDVCILKLLVGIPCPGCGFTRAVFLFLNGKWSESFSMHPLLLPLLVLILLFCMNRYIVRNKKIVHFLRIYVIILAILWVAVYLWRMYQYFPGEEPMVYREGNLLQHLQKAAAR